MLQFEIIHDILVFIGVKKNMSKESYKDQREDEDQILPEGNQTVAPKFTRYMVGTYLDPVSREWMLAYTKFDPVTQTISKLYTERVAGNHEVMLERFQIKVGNLGIMTPDDMNEEHKVEIY